MYFIYSENELEKDFYLHIKQFGLTFYSLKSEQRDYIIERYNSLYKKKSKIRSCIIKKEDGRFLFDIKKKRELQEDEELIDIIESMKTNKKIPVFHQNIERVLSHILVLEIETSKLCKFIDVCDFRIFVHQFINFHYIFNFDENYKQDQNLSLPYSMKSRFIGKKILELNDLTDEMIIKFLFDFYDQESYGCFYVTNYFSDYLFSIFDFLNMIPSDDVFKFIEILEMYFSNARLSQNNILNDIQIMESLLIKKESNNKEKEFVLKTGIIYKESKLKKYHSNDDLSVVLHYLYDMRSTIIHGSTENIFNCYNNKLVQKIKSIDCPKFEGISKMKRKMMILSFTERLTYHFLKIVLIFWIKNNDKIMFLKNN